MSSSFHQRKSYHSIGIYFGTSFFLHLLWENLQAPLFAGYENFWQCFPICLKAATGDMLFMLFIFMTLAILHRNIFWLSNLSSYRHPATWILAIIIGILLAVSFELWAVFVDERWQYAQMPLLPILDIGITPVLQMMGIPSLAIFLTKKYASGRHRNKLIPV